MNGRKWKRGSGETSEAEQPGAPMSMASPTPLVRQTEWPVELAAGGMLMLLPVALYGIAVGLGSWVLTAASATVFLFLVPGLLGTLAFQRWSRTRVTAHVWSLGANSLALVLIGALLRQDRRFPSPNFRGRMVCVDRVAVFGSVAASPVVGHPRPTPVVLWRGHDRRPVRPFLRPSCCCFPSSSSSASTKTARRPINWLEASASMAFPRGNLRTWDPIPGGRMGTVVVNPSLVNSYWTCATQTLVSDEEAATRLPYWVWWAGIFIVSFRQVRLGRGSPWSAVPLALLMSLVAVLFTFYVGYNPLYGGSCESGRHRFAVHAVAAAELRLPAGEGSLGLGRCNPSGVAGALFGPGDAGPDPGGSLVVETNRAQGPVPLGIAGYGHDGRRSGLLPGLGRCGATDR